MALLDVRRPSFSQIEIKRPAFDDSVSDAPVTSVIAGVAGLMQFRAVKIPGGLTFYMDPNGGDSDIAEARDVVAQGTAGKLVVEAAAAPGTGETFTYMVLKNGIATGLTVTLSNSQTKDSIATDVAFADEDDLALRLVTSSGAAQVKHKATIKFTPA